jgi:hypothetical protein
MKIVEMLLIVSQAILDRAQTPAEIFVLTKYIQDTI